MMARALAVPLRSRGSLGSTSNATSSARLGCYWACTHMDKLGTLRQTPGSVKSRGTVVSDRRPVHGCARATSARRLARCLGPYHQCLRIGHEKCRAGRHHCVGTCRTCRFGNDRVARIPRPPPPPHACGPKRGLARGARLFNRGRWLAHCHSRQYWNASPCIGALRPSYRGCHGLGGGGELRSKQTYTLVSPYLVARGSCTRVR